MEKIDLIVGARPNFMKAAPLVREIENNHSDVQYRIVHTGQHYDYSMSERHFQDLELHKPHLNLDVGSDSHAKQTANIMIKLEALWKYNTILKKN